MMNEAHTSLVHHIQARFGEQHFILQETRCDFPVLWVSAEKIKPVLTYLKGIPYQFNLLLDLFAIDERLRNHRQNQPDSDFTVVYHLTSVARNLDIRLKLALKGEYPETGTVTDLFRNANWYEREVWDMFGIRFAGHPLLTRILTPPTFVGHPLRKEFAGRGTEQERFSMTPERLDKEQAALRFSLAQMGMKEEGNSELMILNLGPNHPSVHGAFRIVLQLDG